jgi:hypothetical protein
VCDIYGSELSYCDHLSENTMETEKRRTAYQVSILHVCPALKTEAVSLRLWSVGSYLPNWMKSYTKETQYWFFPSLLLTNQITRLRRPFCGKRTLHGWGQWTDETEGSARSVLSNFVENVRARQSVWQEYLKAFRWQLHHQSRSWVTAYLQS